MTPFWNRVWCTLRKHPTDNLGCSCGRVLTIEGWRKWDTARPPSRSFDSFLAAYLQGLTNDQRAEYDAAVERFEDDA